MESETYEFEHLGITVDNLEETAEWYELNFGFKEISRGEKPALRLKSCKLKLDGLCLEVLEPYEKNAAIKREYRGFDELIRERGMNHLCISVGDIDAAYKQLKDNNVEFVTEIQDSRYFFCRDINGIALEIKQTQ